MTASNLDFDALPADERGRVVENVGFKVFSVPLLLRARTGQFATTNQPRELKGDQSPTYRQFPVCIEPTSSLTAEPRA